MCTYPHVVSSRCFSTPLDPIVDNLDLSLFIIIINSNHKGRRPGVSTPILSIKEISAKIRLPLPSRHVSTIIVYQHHLYQLHEADVMSLDAQMNQRSGYTNEQELLGITDLR